RRNGGQASLRCGTPTTLTHDELKPALTGRTNHYRLQQTKLPNGVHELVELFFIEDRTWLVRVRLALTDCDFSVSRRNVWRRWCVVELSVELVGVPVTRFVPADPARL